MRLEIMQNCGKVQSVGKPSSPQLSATESSTDSCGTCDGPSLMGGEDGRRREDVCRPPQGLPAGGQGAGGREGEGELSIDSPGMVAQC